MKMRDPLLYRIKHATHYRTGDEWVIYPMYDWAHALSDAIEGITHSLCTLEFRDNRDLYDWVVEYTRPGIEEGEPGSWEPRPRQTESARLNLDYTVMSKRKLAELVDDGHVGGWDDPRMPTLAGLRRRGVPPAAIRRFSDLIGVSTADNRIDIGLLEHAIRDDLNRHARRVMCVLHPLRVVIENYPEDRIEELDAPYFPADVGGEGSRLVPFSRVLYIEGEDFAEDPPKGFYRLSPGAEVRLRYGYLVTCTEVVKDPDTGEVVELRCQYDPETKGGTTPDGRKVRGTIHWVSAGRSLPCAVRLYDRLFDVPDPDQGPGGFETHLNPTSLLELGGCRIEPSVADDPDATQYQFERLGYFIRDSVDSRPDALVFNRTVPLRDTWARRRAAGAAAEMDAKRPARDESGRSRTAEGERPASSDETTRGAVGADSGRIARDRARAADAALAERFERYRHELGLPEEQADLLSGDAALVALFEEALETHDSPAGVANWMVNELLREVKETPVAELPFGGGELGRLVALVEDGTISGRTAKQVFGVLVASGGDPDEIVRSEGLSQITDPDEIGSIVDRLLALHPDQVERYRSGQTGLAGFFVGEAMKETGGRANPELTRRLVEDRLG